MPVATISQGQITLPEEVREHLHVTEGDRVEIVLEPRRQVLLRPLRGSAAMAEFLAEANERSRQGEVP